MSYSPLGSMGSMRNSEPLSKKTFNIKLTFSALVTTGIVLFIGIAWSFVLGVMVGRGYNPEKKIPQLASLLPDERKTNIAPGNIVEQIPKGEVMKPEDLGFMVSLKGKPGDKTADKSAPGQKNATDSKMRPLSNAMAPVQAGINTNSTAVMTKPLEVPAVKQTPPKPEPKPEQFDYVYQVATFKDTESVDKVRAKLEGHGLRSGMEKEGKLLKVIVTYRGTEESAKSVKQTFTEVGLGQPILRSKKPVGKPASTAKKK